MPEQQMIMTYGVLMPSTNASVIDTVLAGFPTTDAAREYLATDGRDGRVVRVIEYREVSS